ncbi:MAG: T9SS type A sorting domain-containing protein [Candidatus Kapaibacterium sp.]
MKLTPHLIAIALLAPVMARAQTFVAHEWGTFTTLQGSDGVMLPGLYLEEESLPAFVHCYDGFSPDATVRNKGLYRPGIGVTVKMETPVIYFYSGTSLNADVRVDFPNGAISQWYPERTSGTEEAGLEPIDFTKQYNGFIDWRVTLLAPDSGDYTAPAEQETPTWTSPRATDANLVKGEKGETEKFLFYRGVGNFDVPLHARFTSPGLMEITNTGAEPIPYVFIYDMDKQGARVIWTGPLAPGASERVEPATAAPLDSASLAAKFMEFNAALTGAGLYPKESAAMLATWRYSYFGTRGLRVFWIVPRGFTDRTLPLSINPAPESLQRVLVGRSEVLSPELEAHLVSEFKIASDLPDWNGDRYYLAYRERAARLVAALGTASRMTGEMGLSISPNPTEGSYHVTARVGRDIPVELEVTDMLGNSLMAFREMPHDGGVEREIDMRSFPSGMYILHLRSGGSEWTRKIIRM